MNPLHTSTAKCIDEIENLVLKGLVLDENGKWVSIADKKAQEEAFLAHLSAGEVLIAGQWITIDDAKTAANRPVEVLEPDQPLMITDIAGNPIEDPPETTTLVTNTGPEEETTVTVKPVDKPGQETKTEYFLPETKSYDAVGETPRSKALSVSPIDPVTDFAPETNFFAVENPASDITPSSVPAATTASQSETTFFSAAEIPCWPPPSPKKSSAWKWWFIAGGVLLGALALLTAKGLLHLNFVF